MNEKDVVQQDQPPSSSQAKHVLVVGGTGMLRPTSLALANQYPLVTVIARNSNRLHDLWEEARDQGLRINPLQLDYKEPDHLRLALTDTVQHLGPVDIVVAWIKQNAEEANTTIAQILNNQQRPVQYYDLIGSFHYKDFEVEEEERKALFEDYANIAYHQIKLGLQWDDEAQDDTRWLTYEEITDGVLKAMKANTPEYFIGDLAASYP